jgi:cellulose synthase/poly-beta-1,6-N-acetylglucosamine synthase-like glycosyltransferase
MNLGIRSARGEIVMKMDAHTIYTREYISQCVRFLLAYDADNVGGVIRTLPRDGTLVGRAIAAALSNRFGVGNSQFRIGGGEPRWADTAFSGCYRKATLERIGLYDERIEFSEDIVLNSKLTRAGGRILLVPGIVSDYLARSDMRSFWLHNWRNGKWTILPLRYADGLPVSWRHLAPLGLVVGLAGLAALALSGAISPLFFTAFAGAYAAASLGASARVAVAAKDARFVLVMPVVFSALHVGYGVGSLIGAWSVLVSRLARPIGAGKPR